MTESDLRAQIEALLNKLDAMEAPVNACIQMSAIHGFPYTGPNWGEEVKALRDVLAVPAAPHGDTREGFAGLPEHLQPSNLPAPEQPYGNVVIRDRKYYESSGLNLSAPSVGASPRPLKIAMMMAGIIEAMAMSHYARGISGSLALRDWKRLADEIAALPAAQDETPQ